MTEPNPPASDVRPPEPAPAPAAPMSLAARLLNVVAAPGEAFDDIKHKPVNHANWAVPATLNGFGSDANNKYITTYYRGAFNVPDASSITNLRAQLKRDDGAVVDAFSGQED